MPAYNFQKQFSFAVKSGRKRQTIRPRRKRQTKQGDTLYLYVGQRTKGCRLLRKVRCKCVKDIQIDGVPYLPYISLDGRRLDDRQIEALALADGFKSVREFYDFFDGKYGHMIAPDLELIGW